MANKTGSAIARGRDTTKSDKDNRFMALGGQGAAGPVARKLERGYAMAALLISLSVMSVLMGAMLPVWSHMLQREKEEELIFRGQQYARAIGLFQRKFANTAPPTIDLLVEQRFLRKKYKDPITNDDFQPLYASQAPQGVSAPSGAQRPGQIASADQATQPAPIGSGAGSNSPTAAGGIIGVASKSTGTSIKVYNGRNKYNEWAFVYVQTAQRPGGLAGGDQRGRTGVPGQGQPQSPIGMPGAPSPGTGQRPPSQSPRPPVEFPGFRPFGAPQQPGTVRPPG
jgi:type II secretory pathway pseudopilin PulG